MKTIKIILSYKCNSRVYKTVIKLIYINYSDTILYKLYFLLVTPLLMSFEYLSPAESVHPPIEIITLMSSDFGLETNLS